MNRFDQEATKPCLYAVPGGVLSLSGPALRDLLRAILARNVPFRFRARGFSMSPFIRDDDIVTVSPKAGREPQAGDVVAVYHLQTQKLIIHRILARKAGGCLVQGDNLSRSDGLILPENVLGRVTRVERDGRPVLLGLGPERRLIALLIRHDLWQPIVHGIGLVLCPFLKFRLLWRRFQPHPVSYKHGGPA